MDNKYKVNDKVIIKSLEWYESNKDENGDVRFPAPEEPFVRTMAQYCGKTAFVVNVCPDGLLELDIDRKRNYWHNGFFQN